MALLIPVGLIWDVQLDLGSWNIWDLLQFFVGFE